ncbi:MAG: hypothetical protein GF341_04950 [candidate division Zixibacteria bacterium]|nr:hypothetical protein [candidate division Zixibacteria bacterium]
MSETIREFFRHALATLAYRAAKTMRDAPPGFADFRPGPTSKTPVQIVAHMGDLIESSSRAAEGNPSWEPQAPQTWEPECARFFAALKSFDTFLASEDPVKGDLRLIFQGPVADALTHTGQLAMLRRLAGSPIGGEGYNVADIVVGRVGPDQTPPDPQNEFD